MGKKGGKFFLGHILKYPPISVVLEYILIFTIIMPFNKTTAHLVRPHPFSTLCPTPLGKSPVCANNYVSVDAYKSRHLL